MGDVLIPVLEVVENNYDGVSQRHHHFRSSSFDASFLGRYVMHNEGRRDSLERDTNLESSVRHLKQRCKEKDYMTWDQWDAALIALKRKDEKKQEPFSYRICRSINFVNDVVQKDCRCTSCSSSCKDRCSRLFNVGQAVAALTLYGMSSVNLTVFEDRLSAENYETFHKSLFMRVARSVLSIFDMEDFERIYNRNLVEEEYASVVSDLLLLKLGNVKIPGDCSIFMKYYKEGPSQLRLTESSSFADAHGMVDSNNIYSLREHDVCEILREYRLSTSKDYIKVSPWFFLDKEHWVGVSEKDIYNAIYQMQDHVPIKECYKTQLTLELTRAKCYHVFDSLVIVTLADISLGDLFEYVGHRDKSFGEDQKEEAFKGFVEGVVNGLHRLAALKSYALNHVQGAITFPISLGEFGPCTKEVLEVMKIADHERRKLGHPFISLQHVLFGLSLSRFGYCSEILKRMLTYLSGEPPEFCLLKFYKTCRDLATGRVEQSASKKERNVVELPDLVGAILLHDKDSTRRAVMELEIIDKAEGTYEEKTWEEELQDSHVFPEVMLEWTSKGAQLVCEEGKEFIRALEDFKERHPLMFSRDIWV